MPKILYFDCFSGASGDMILGALIDAGLPIDELRAALGSLALEGARVDAQPTQRSGIGATSFTVIDGSASQSHDEAPGHDESHALGEGHTYARDYGHAQDFEHGHLDHDQSHEHRGSSQPSQPSQPSRQSHDGERHSHDHHDHHAHDPHDDGQHHHHNHDAHRSLSEICGMVDRSALSAASKDRAKRLFRRLAEVEAAIHQMPVEKVHLHEVGAVDSIIDIAGCVFGLEWFGADRIVVSPINVGSGTVKCEHGVMPVPAPATTKLIEGVPVYSKGPAVELLTPTGALVLTDYAESYGPMPPMRIGQSGYGAGDRDFPDHPNLLRVLVGQEEEERADRAPRQLQRVVVLECEIDDMNPQIFGLLMDRLHEAGALDVFYVPIQMKKNRPGTLVTVVALPEHREALSGIVFRETTTIGVRFREMERERLDREQIDVKTPLGVVRFKVARRSGEQGILNAAPEFEDCARLAEEHALPVKEVQGIATRAYLESREARED